MAKRPNTVLPNRSVSVDKPFDLVGLICYSCPVVGSNFYGIAGIELVLHPSNPTDPRILYPNVLPAQRATGRTESSG